MKMFNLADNLEGYTLGKWTVQSKIPHNASTGGFFSIGYNVIDDKGNEGFLKALDFSKAFRTPSPMDTLRSMTNAYTYERDLLNKCRDKRLRYIVKIVDCGEFHLDFKDYPPNTMVPYPDVSYIVLEKAEASVRSIIDISKSIDYAWALRSLHNVAVGIQEMHGVQIAHQDIKPSNVLLFESKKKSKLTDFGRSSTIDQAAEHDDLSCAGDISYSPFEQLYGVVHPDWKVRRYSCDMFMFGNLIMTYFNNISVTTSVINQLHPNFHPRNWPGTYDELLPQIELAFTECIENFNQNVDEELRKELIIMIKQLCHPDIKKRGIVRSQGLKSVQFSLQQYISRLDLLARKWEYSFRKVNL